MDALIGPAKHCRERQRQPPPGLEFVNEPIGAFAKRLRAQPGKDIWMMGGGGVIGSFLDEGEIDEFIIHVVPIFIGEGIPHSVVRLHYRVLPQT